MEEFRRYAVYVLPGGSLADFGRNWLGWALTTGQPAPQMLVPGLPRPLADLTASAAPYGLHATIKPPFHLAPGQTLAALQGAVAALATQIAPVRLAGLTLTDLEGFLALTPAGDTTALNALAAAAVRNLDRFRAAAPAAELARRRAVGLTARQEANLIRWGYPYVMQDFAFHLTLTGRLTQPEAAGIRAILAPLIQPVLPVPYCIAALALVGQMQNGWFKLIHTYPLSG